MCYYIAPSRAGPCFRPDQQRKQHRNGLVATGKMKSRCARYMHQNNEHDADDRS